MPQHRIALFYSGAVKPAPFAYHNPATIPETIALLAELAPEEERILAGGQSLVPIMAFRLACPAHLIDINRVAGLDRLEVADGRLHIGARVRPVPATAGDQGQAIPDRRAQIGNIVARAMNRLGGKVAFISGAVRGVRRFRPAVVERTPRLAGLGRRPYPPS